MEALTLIGRGGGTALTGDRPAAAAAAAAAAGGGGRGGGVVARWTLQGKSQKAYGLWGLNKALND